VERRLQLDTSQEDFGEASGVHRTYVRHHPGLNSPVAQDAHFVGTATLDLDRTLPLDIHNAIPRCAARSTAALRNDGVEDVAALALVEHQSAGHRIARVSADGQRVSLIGPSHLLFR
jgi:hypothetical protein